VDTRFFSLARSGKKVCGSGQKKKSHPTSLNGLLNLFVTEDRVFSNHFEGDMRFLAEMNV
jgi:hypothetical protein